MDNLIEGLPGAKPVREASKDIIERFGKNLSEFCDQEFRNIQAIERADYDRILAAMALGSVSAATGIMMEINDEAFTAKVMEQCLNIIKKTLEVKRVRDNGN